MKGSERQDLEGGGKELGWGGGQAELSLCTLHRSPGLLSAGRSRREGGGSSQMEDRAVGMERRPPTC